jgi:haloacetate dehalogenase
MSERKPERPVPLGAAPRQSGKATRASDRATSDSGGTLFEGFQRTRITPEATGVEINVMFGGSGPPLLLLHGFPQTHAMWHPIAPRFAEKYSVVVPDLRGYGDSAKPAGGGDHADYSFRAMATDQIEVMKALGHERFMFIGHDRGARVGHRLALDHPGAVERLGLLDIVPTSFVYANTDRRLATAYFHWFFLIQAEPLPERLIGGDPLFILRRFLAFSGGLDGYAPEALAEYERCFVDPATIHAMCEDYRAGAGIDLEHDEADRNRKIERPVLILWGTRGAVGALYEPLDVWRSFATDVRGHAIEAGHYLVEERPDDTFAALASFLAP